MEIIIQNSRLKLTVSTLGAQMMSLEDEQGIQYLWQGDPKYWTDRAPVLFPFVGRLTNNAYSYHGTTYSMGIHGFAAMQEFVVEARTSNMLVLRLDSNTDTLVQYPFTFSFLVTYLLVDNTVRIAYEVRNYSKETMPFGVGGHPGFNVPFSVGETFEDYILEFSQPCCPDRVGFTPTVFISGHDEPYALKDGRQLALRHDLFNEDAIVLKNMDRTVTLYSQKSGQSITVSYPQMSYLGIWHWPNTDSPYICIEPWSSLPARQDVVEELSCKSDMIHLQSDCVYTNSWSITIGNRNSI